MILYITKKFDNSFFKYNFFFSKRSLFDYFISKVNQNKHIRIETNKVLIFETEKYSRFNLIGNEYKEACFSTFYLNKNKKHITLRNRMALMSMFNNLGGERDVNIFQQSYNTLKSSSENINFILLKMNNLS